MEEFELKTEYIHLNQLLKVMGWVQDGAMANEVIDAGMVMVDDETELRRRNKIKAGSIIKFDGHVVKVKS